MFDVTLSMISINPGWFLLLFLPIFRTKMKKKIVKPTKSFFHWKLLEKIAPVGCNSFFILVLKIVKNSKKNHPVLRMNFRKSFKGRGGAFSIQKIISVPKWNSHQAKIAYLISGESIGFYWRLYPLKHLKITYKTKILERQNWCQIKKGELELELRAVWVNSKENWIPIFLPLPRHYRTPHSWFQPKLRRIKKSLNQGEKVVHGNIICLH